jgi:hypothetical protein
MARRSLDNLSAAAEKVPIPSPVCTREADKSDVPLDSSLRYLSPSDCRKGFFVSLLGPDLSDMKPDNSNGHPVGTSTEHIHKKNQRHEQLAF